MPHSHQSLMELIPPRHVFLNSVQYALGLGLVKLIGMHCALNTPCLSANRESVPLLLGGGGDNRLSAGGLHPVFSVLSCQ